MNTTRRRFSRAAVLPCCLILLGLALSQPEHVKAQWTTPTPPDTNISNTNTGNVGIGTSAPASLLHVATESNAVTRGIISAQHSENSNGAMFRFWKSRGTKTSPTAVANADSLGLLYTDGYDGASYISGGRLKFTVDGAVSTGVMPTAVQFFSGNSGGGVERMRVSSSGNVGIGTTAPNYNLEIQGSASRNILALTGDGDAVGYAGLKIQALTTTGIATNRTSQFNLHMRKDSWYGGDGSGPSFIIETASKTGGFAAPFMITPINDVILNGGTGASGLSYGNVGIGKTAPVYKLDVNGEINATGFRINGTPITTGGSSQWTTSGSNIYFNTGNVGIGTDIPTTKLHVTGGTRVDGPNGRVYLGTSAATGARGLEFIEENATTYSIRHHDPNVAWQNIAISPYGGNVGVGTATPARKLHVMGGNILHQFSATAGQEYGFYTAIRNNHFTSNTYFDGQWKMMTAGKGAFVATAPQDGVAFDVIADNTYRAANALVSLNSLMRVNMDGNVGIGTPSPGYKLDVQGGTINASGGLCIAGTCKTDWSQVSGSQWSNSSSNIYFNTGIVGIGAASPAAPLYVTGNEPSTDYATLRVKPSVTHGGIVIDSANDASQAHLRFFKSGVPKWQFRVPFQDGVEDFRLYSWAAGSDVLSITPSGNVGIGTGATAPATKLQVAGDITVSGTGNINATGTITGGTIHAKYQDVAEWVESSQSLSAGTVVVLDQTKSNQVVASSQAYDTRVAGVISLQPGITLGENGAGKVLVATTGRVKIKVDASAGPIQIGDLLVTSDVVGVAKKSEALNLGGVAIHRPGTLIGKALEPLAKGTGEILVLLSLQ